MGNPSRGRFLFVRVMFAPHTPSFNPILFDLPKAVVLLNLLECQRATIPSAAVFPSALWRAVADVLCSTAGLG